MISIDSWNRLLKTCWGIHLAGVRSSPDGSDNGSISPVKRRRSLPRGAASFVSLRDSDGVDRQSLVNQFNESRTTQLRVDLSKMEEMVAWAVGQQNMFQKASNLLVSQVAESLATLGNSRAKREKLFETRQSIISDLTIQTQQVIQQSQTTSQDMKQQWELNSQFVGIDRWRKNVEEEFTREKGHHQIYQNV